MKTLPLVIKMGGRLLQERPALDALLAVCCQLKQQRPVVLVHGGGDQVDLWLAKFGFSTEKIDGQRVSPAEQMPVITGALDGAVNAELVSRAMQQGLNPVGLNLSAGASLKFTVNTKLGAVGLAKANSATLIQLLLEQGFTPVFSSVGIGSEGQLLNVNADLAAAAICQLVQGELVLLTDVPGILDSQMQLIAELSPAGAAELVASGVIKGGMKVKLDAALETGLALRRNIIVAGWQQPENLLKLMQNEPVGTCILY
ncbi:MAG: acetylglutamate kinase [Rheinheimera sp.]|uniref:acetylglutamate kinase n=1 Tax=Arsukibacterium sp. UBA3155 TaxID=1946058 RepID=UPI000C8FA666|nr:acetylglutamate kinase [Arsukibacterium sp. UBA3155]MAD76284.1 acetylglutamate kinase [Rheinheimera sp.]|tara:strand:+ start:40326 stop:41096 length:771 start_codon:yes stop_codon:yes gene_type:complete